MKTIVRALGPLIALAPAGSTLLAETGPESHPDKAIPISAELAKKCARWRSRPFLRSGREGKPMHRRSGIISKTALPKAAICRTETHSISRPLAEVKVARSRSGNTPRIRPMVVRALARSPAFGRQMHHDPDVDELSGRHIVDIAKNCVGVRLLDVMRARVALPLFRKAVADLRDAGTSVARGGDYARLLTGKPALCCRRPPPPS